LKATHPLVKILSIVPKSSGPHGLWELQPMLGKYPKKGENQPRFHLFLLPSPTLVKQIHNGTTYTLKKKKKN
jgi:hypothetical protein